MIFKKQFEKTELATGENQPVQVITPGGEKKQLLPFLKQDISLHYSSSGIETVEPVGKPYTVVRFFPAQCGVYRVQTGQTEQLVQVEPSNAKGCITVNPKNPKYLAYSNGEPFFPIGVNLAFISPVAQSNGAEFGTAASRQYLGLRQYKRWFKACAENGVNMARIWLGHEYFCPDEDEANQFSLTQLAKIDLLLELAESYGIKLKLTVEQFRHFDYCTAAESNSYADDVFRKFNKKLYLNGERCNSVEEFLTAPKWKAAWLNKVQELGKRLSGNPTVFGIELWNEMNALGRDRVIAWNAEMLPKVKQIFAPHLVMNSLGSLDCQSTEAFYKDFCFEKSDLKQLHRYLDRGAENPVCHESPIQLLKNGIETLQTPNQPLLVAETGAVSPCHSGPFSYYCCDHLGLLFCDFVYTPVFCGACGTGNLWHWDDRYMEAKNLYHCFRPMAELCREVDFGTENFKPDYYEDAEIILLLLRGKNVTLGYLRNKSACWQNLLRDLKQPVAVKEKAVACSLPQQLEVVQIFLDETVDCRCSNGALQIRNLKYGALLRFS